MVVSGLQKLQLSHSDGLSKLRLLEVDLPAQECGFVSGVDTKHDAGHRQAQPHRKLSRVHSASRGGWYL